MGKTKSKRKAYYRTTVYSSLSLPLSLSDYSVLKRKIVGWSVVLSINHHQTFFQFLNRGRRERERKHTFSGEELREVINLSYRITPVGTHRLSQTLSQTHSGLLRQAYLEPSAIVCVCVALLAFPNQRINRKKGT